MGVKRILSVRFVFVDMIMHLIRVVRCSSAIYNLVIVRSFISQKRLRDSSMLFFFESYLS